MSILLESILWLLGIGLEFYLILAVVNIVLYWGMHFNIIGQGGDAFKKLLNFLHKVTEPVYEKLREHIKPISGFDISPYALILILAFVLHLIEKACIELAPVAG
ncbi:MAG: YggT family protein [Alphaproteobacteria bacterium]|nr:YggT family protein [Alphaproteobacteria bacterium]